VQEMDIRNFFKKARLDDCNQVVEVEDQSSGSTILPSEVTTPSTSQDLDGSERTFNKFDIGHYINTISIMSAEERCAAFKNIWTPSENYNFKKVSVKRSFRYEWLKTYAPWLAYSEVNEGALCKFCVLFKQKVHRGLQGSFVLKGFTKYKDFNEAARNHTRSEWHQNSVSEGTNVMAIYDKQKQSIINSISQSRVDLINKNRTRLESIVRTIIFCGTHDLALRGKDSNEGNFKDLLMFRVQAGDSVLKNHLEKGAKNAQYTSVQIEHEIINICEQTLVSRIVSIVNKSKCFSILADETSDIAGIEQLSFGVRYAIFENNKLTIAEEFLGYVELKQFDAQFIGDAILSKCASLDLNMEYCVGQGYDGCAVMSGKENGVKAIVQRKYPKAHYVHCSSHRLNLVLHDLNNLSDIRNTIGTIKEIINFFRESNVRRQLLPSIPMLCETRWVEKHKSIRLFKKYFDIILEKLLEVSEGSTTGKQKAYCLHCAATKPAFLLCLFIMAKYSELLEPISAILQGKQVNLSDCHNHIKILTSTLNDERNKFDPIFAECRNFSQTIGIDIVIPRTAARQTKRANYSSSDPKEYYKLSLFLPYIDSLISSLNIRFSEENTHIFNLFRLYPSTFKTMTEGEATKLLMEIDDDLLTEGLVWHKVVQSLDSSSLDLMLKSAEFIPKIQAVLLKSLALPVSTATIERSFSTLRRVKTWLRSTMSESRLSGLCMLSVHRQKIKDDEEGFITQVIDTFGKTERKLVFLFEQ
jgi:hypothetical protein